MIKYEEGKLEKDESGACFPERPYYPLLSSNGTDAVLLTLGGFPDDPDWMCYSMPLPFRINPGWYKTARKDYEYAHRHYGPSTYGTSPALAGVTTMPTIGKDRNLGIRSPKQFFDPEKRILTSSYSINESRGNIPAELKVTSFITHEHLLVEHYEVLREPESGFRLGFRLDTPHSSDLHELCVHPEKIEYEKMENGLSFSYKYHSPEVYDGMAAAWVDCPGCEFEEELGHLNTAFSPVIPEGKSITRYTAVIDSYDSRDYRAEIKRLFKKTIHEGYDVIFEEHIKYAGKYTNVSSVTLPEKDLEYIYDYSNYVLDATQDSDSGFMPMGILPCNWHNAMFWDCWFASMAWLGSNRIEAAKKISYFYKNKLEEALTVAEKLNCNGARYAWTTNRAHFELNPESVLQFHNNAVIALQSLQVYEATGDIEFLNDIFDLVEQSLVFLTERLVKIENGKALLTECVGIDEAHHDLKGTDTWTASVYVKALTLYLEACRSLKRKPFKDTLDEVAAMLFDAVNSNVDDNGVLQSFDGGRRPHWGSLIFNLYPDNPALEKTIDVLSFYDEELDTYASHGVPGYRGRVFTWTEYWIAAIYGMTGNPEGWNRLKKCAKFTDRFGSIPERVFYDGELLKRPFMTSHACYIWAVNSLLMSRKGKRLSVLMNLPDNWTDLSFENLTTPDGLKASAAMKKGRITACKVVNINYEKRDVYLNLPGMDEIEIRLNSLDAYEI